MHKFILGIAALGLAALAITLFIWLRVARGRARRALAGPPVAPPRA